jgi:hypothetical protein
MRGEREIALTTPVSLTALQPSLSGTDHLSHGSRHFMPGYDHRSLRDKIRQAARAKALSCSVWPFHGRVIPNRRRRSRRFRSFKPESARSG